VSGWTTSLLTGLAQHLAGGGIGTWRATGTYTSAETAITIRAAPPSPDRVVVLAAYPVRSAPGTVDITTGVQIRTRAGADPRDCDDLADAIFDLLDSAGGLVLGGIHVTQIYRQSYASLGRDQRSRWERSDNYYLDAVRPTAHRTD
jgi:hypothetical protein